MTYGQLQTYEREKVRRVLVDEEREFLTSSKAQVAARLLEEDKVRLATTLGSFDPGNKPIMPNYEELVTRTITVPSPTDEDPNATKTTFVEERKFKDKDAFDVAFKVYSETIKEWNKCAAVVDNMKIRHQDYIVKYHGRAKQFCQVAFPNAAQQLYEEKGMKDSAVEACEIFDYVKKSVNEAFTLDTFSTYTLSLKEVKELMDAAMACVPNLQYLLQREYMSKRCRA
ncbi:hypothetical protein HDV05_005880 [Chytridiales sp. JEL 0842]|nr:hypothetical protein HDV05_005880 [Chytridiales sp. JEL 0842]